MDFTDEEITRNAQVTVTWQRVREIERQREREREKVEKEEEAKRLRCV